MLFWKSKNIILDNESINDIINIKGVVCPYYYKNQRQFQTKNNTLLDSSAYWNYIQKKLISSRYHEKTNEQLPSTNENQLQINRKLSNAYIYDKKYCSKIHWFKVKQKIKRLF